MLLTLKNIKKKKYKIFGVWEFSPENYKKRHKAFS